jgi:pimeloyl-ACP methyl ester carboxylesterase
VKWEDIGPEAYVRQLTAVMGRADSRPTLAVISCPTLVLTSDQDNTVPSTLSVEIADGIPGAKLVTIAECGHLSQIEQPEAVAAALVEWLRN